MSLLLLSYVTFWTVLVTIATGKWEVFGNYYRGRLLITRKEWPTGLVGEKQESEPGREQTLKEEKTENISLMTPIRPFLIIPNSAISTCLDWTCAWTSRSDLDMSRLDRQGRIRRRIHFIKQRTGPTMICRYPGWFLNLVRLACLSWAVLCFAALRDLRD